MMTTMSRAGTTDSIVRFAINCKELYRTPGVLMGMNQFVKVYELRDVRSYPFAGETKVAHPRVQLFISYNTCYSRPINQYLPLISDCLAMDRTQRHTMLRVFWFSHTTSACESAVSEHRPNKNDTKNLELDPVRLNLSYKMDMLCTCVIYLWAR
jgi:hypothetical protein